MGFPRKQKKKKPKDEPTLGPAAAMMATFDEYKEVPCVSLQKGGRVENVVSTGSLILDLILGGGLQRGRIVEVYGPEGSGKTTIMLSTIAMGQKANIPCGVYDTEHSLDPTYMRSIGVDLEFMIEEDGQRVPGFYYSQPGPGEHVYMAIMKTLDKMRPIDPEVPGPPTMIFCIDSFAAMFSEAEDMEKSGKGGLGRDARMHSVWLRQLKGRLRAKGALLFVTNQIRMKLNLTNPNACLHGDTAVIKADGTQCDIATIVANKDPGPVLSYNHETELYEPRAITGWHNNGRLEYEDGERWTTINLGSAGGNGGFVSLTCTPNHQVFVQRDGEIAEVSAEDVGPGDVMMTWYDECIDTNPAARDIVHGSLLGDGGISYMAHKPGALARFSLANQEQPEYLQWKLDKLSGFHWNEVLPGKHERPCYRTATRTDLSLLKDKFYQWGPYRGIPADLKLTPLTLAVWFMDDGHSAFNATDGHAQYCVLSIKRLFLPEYEGQPDRAAAMLRALLGTDDGITVSKSQRALIINRAAAELMFSVICPFVPVCMDYKIPAEYRGRYIEFHPSADWREERRVYPLKVVSVGEASKRKHRGKHKYDITVEGNSNYLAGGAQRGVLVHNSPENRPGGHAMKHYADYVVRVSTSKRAKTDTQDLDRQHMYIRVIKNKCFPPFRECEHEILLGRGFDKKEDALMFLKAIGRHEIKGAYHRILLKPFLTPKGMPGPKFREVVETQKFRDYAFKLLRKEKVYGAYFKQSGYMNFSYDMDTEPNTEMEDQEGAGDQDDE